MAAFLVVATTVPACLRRFDTGTCSQQFTTMLIARLATYVVDGVAHCALDRRRGKIRRFDNLAAHTRWGFVFIVLPARGTAPVESAENMRLFRRENGT